MYRSLYRRSSILHRLGQLTGGSVDLLTSDEIARVTINQPTKMNSLTGSMMVDLQRIVRELEQMNNIKAVIFTGQGDKAFCAGSDLR